MQAQNYAVGSQITITAGDTAITAGAPQRINNVINGIPINDIAAAAKGELQVGGVIKGICDESVGIAGNLVGWDANGSPVSGAAGSGAFTTDLSAADYIVGTLTEDKAKTDTHCYFKLGSLPAGTEDWVNRLHIATAVDKTPAAKEAGCVIHVTADSKTVTLPTSGAAYAGYRITIVNMAPGAAGDGTVVTLNTADKFQGQNLNGGTGVKPLTNTRATAKKGDFITVICNGATGGVWNVEAKRGVWALTA